MNLAARSPGDGEARLRLVLSWMVMVRQCHKNIGSSDIPVFVKGKVQHGASDTCTCERGAGREEGDSPSLEVFKPCLDVIFGDMV